jgi:hypothetical protein
MDKRVKIEIPEYAFKFLKEKSYYNHQFYKIEDCGDSIMSCGAVILRECQEEYNTYFYQIGYFKDDKFIPLLGIDISDDLFENIDKKFKAGDEDVI